jgi:hypothetical protein
LRQIKKSLIGLALEVEQICTRDQSYTNFSLS